MIQKQMETSESYGRANVLMRGNRDRTGTTFLVIADNNNRSE